MNEEQILWGLGFYLKGRRRGGKGALGMGAGGGASRGRGRVERRFRVGREREELEPGPSSRRRPAARGQCGSGGEGYGVRPRAADPRVTHVKQQVTAPNQLRYQEGRQIWQRRCLCQESQAPLAETVVLLPPLRTPERIHLTPWAFGRALIRL